MWQGVLYIILAQLMVIGAGSFLLLWPYNNPTGKDASPKEQPMMILSMLVCDTCRYPLSLGKEHRCPPKRFCLEGCCGTPFYSNDPSRTLCSAHLAYELSCNPQGLAPGLLGVPAVQEALDIINMEATKTFINAYDSMLSRQHEMEGM